MATLTFLDAQSQSIKQGIAFDSPTNALAHIQAFIQTYQIDTSALLEPDITKYRTFNEFFYRRLKPDARPPAHPEDPDVVSSAADCRLTVFQTVDKAKEIWIKVSAACSACVLGARSPTLPISGSIRRVSCPLRETGVAHSLNNIQGHNFTVPHLLGDEKLAKDFENGEIAVFRLAPADYHRYHSPIAGTVGKSTSIKGSYFVRLSLCGPAYLASARSCINAGTFLRMVTLGRTDCQPCLRERRPRRLYQEQTRWCAPPPSSLSDSRSVKLTSGEMMSHPRRSHHALVRPTRRFDRPRRVRASRSDARWEHCPNAGRREEDQAGGRVGLFRCVKSHFFDCQGGQQMSSRAYAGLFCVLCFQFDRRTAYG